MLRHIAGTQAICVENIMGIPRQTDRQVSFYSLSETNVSFPMRGWLFTNLLPMVSYRHRGREPASSLKGQNALSYHRADEKQHVQPYECGQVEDLLRYILFGYFYK